MSFGSNRELISGTRVAGYQIEHELGRGAMAVVYLAIQLNLQRRVALKVLADELAASDEFVVRFFNEARAAAALSHPHIVQAFDAGIAEGGIHYFAMEYVEGETLLERIKRQGYLRAGPGLQLALHIAEALNYGWQRQGLTHGDIKPENVMINTEGHSKLADFGLAKIEEHDFEGSDIMLTPLYAAPEMILGEATKGDCRSDIYSFGATLYHMFAGSPPYPGAHAEEVMQRHLTEPLESLRERNPAIPGRISDVVEVMLSKSAADRPASWDNIIDQLKAIRSHLDNPSVVIRAARPAATRQSARRSGGSASRWLPRRALRGWLAAFMCILVAGGALLLIAQYTAHQPVGALSPAASANGPTVSAPSGQRSAERTDEDAGASSEPSDEAWRILQVRLDNEDDPEQARELLAAYVKSHEGQVPEGFDAVVARYDEDVRQQDREHDPIVSPPAETSENRRPDNAADGLQNEDKERSRADDPTFSRISNTGEPAARESAFMGGHTPVRLHISQAGRRQDAATWYLSHLSRFSYHLPLKMEGPVQAGREWLLEYPEPSAERDRISFAVGTVLPALEEVLPKLVAHSDALTGEKIPGDGYVNCTVHEVTMDKLVLRERTRHGVMFRNVSWHRQSDPLLHLVYLSRLTALKAGTWEERGPYLALLLFSKYGEELWEKAVSGLPLTPEGKEWQDFRKALSAAPEEYQPLAIWREIQEAVEQSNRNAVYHLAKRLRGTRSQTSERHAEQLKSLISQTQQAVPSVSGGQLVRQAAEYLKQDPGRALTLLLSARSRYGHADFPEKEQIELLVNKALRDIPLPEWLERAAEKHPLTAVSPFATPAVPVPQYLPVRVFAAAEDAADGMSAGKRRSLAAMRGSCLLQAGDWAAAESALAQVKSTDVERLPAELRSVLAFSRALLNERYGRESCEQAIATLSKLATERQSLRPNRSLLGPILLIEYDLLDRYNRTSTTTHVSLGKDPDVGSQEARQRLFYGSVTRHLQQGEVDAALSLLNAALDDSRSSRQWGLDSQDREFLSASMRVLQETGGPADVESLVAGPLNEWQLRLSISTMLQRGGVTEQAWLKTTELLELHGETLGLVGGSACYDALLARTGNRLAAGSISDALQAVDWALQKPYPCLTPFYARLCFLRWGLLQLMSPGSADDLRHVVAAASCASDSEKALASVYVDPEANRRLRQLSDQDPELDFWHGWLKSARRVALGQSGAAAAWQGDWSARHLPMAEQLLLNGFGAWGRQIAAAAERDVD